MPWPPLSDADFADIQGLVRFGYGHLEAARFHVLRIVDPDAVRRWLSQVPLASAVRGNSPDAAVQLALSYAGLLKLTGDLDLLDQFPYDFKSGMAEPSRARRLGDVGGNDRAKWAWGGDPTDQPDILVLTYALDDEALTSWETKLQNESWRVGFATLACLATKDIGNVEPFGFDDGISQPEVDWERTRSTRIKNTTSYTNQSALGEFLLGYPNEYGKYTDRPLLEPDAANADLLPWAEDASDRKDFGRNGTYLVLRDLSQDGPAFWDYVADQARVDDEDPDLVAASIGGRVPSSLPQPSDQPHRPTIPSGLPMVPLSDQPIGGVDRGPADVRRNQFTYRKDLDGESCPLGAHIRRANPRTADLPEGTRGRWQQLVRILGFGRRHFHDDLIASTRFHRILRRGREYVLEVETENQERIVVRGLRFICLNANIGRQFEFVQTSWFANSHFEGLGETDPLLGNREPRPTGESTDTYSRPQQNGLCYRSASVPQFVHVRGGGYFFMPSLSAVRFLAAGATTRPAAWSGRAGTEGSASMPEQP